jgi:hypothetical protein
MPNPLGELRHLLPSWPRWRTTPGVACARGPAPIAGAVTARTASGGPRGRRTTASTAIQAAKCRAGTATGPPFARAARPRRSPRLTKSPTRSTPSPAHSRGYATFATSYPAMATGRPCSTSSAGAGLARRASPASEEPQPHDRCQLPDSRQSSLRPRLVMPGTDPHRRPRELRRLSKSPEPNGGDGVSKAMPRHIVDAIAGANLP